MTEVANLTLKLVIPRRMFSQRKVKCFGKKRANTMVSKDELTSELKLEFRMGLRDSFAEKRKKANEKEENKDYNCFVKVWKLI